MAPEFIQEDETAGKSEGDSLKISIGDIDIYPEVPSFYTKDYVGAGISISS